MKKVQSLKLPSIKGGAKLVGKCKISEPSFVHYSDSNGYEIGNLLFCDLFSIIYDLKQKRKFKPGKEHFLHSSSNCKYMTVKSGEWNLYEQIKKWDDRLIMVNNAVDIDEFMFDDSFKTFACPYGCTVQILDVSKMWFTTEMLCEWEKINEQNNGLGFYKGYPLIFTGGDTGINMKCYKFNNEICAISISGLHENGKTKEIQPDTNEKNKEISEKIEYACDLITLLIIDNDGVEHTRTIDKNLINFIPVIKELIDDLSPTSQPISIKLPDYTDINDFDEFIETITGYLMFGSNKTLRLMGPASIAGFLGVNLDLKFDIGGINIDINSDFTVVSAKLLEKHGIIAQIEYDHPYIKFSFPDKKYSDEKELENAIDFIITHQIYDDYNHLTLTYKNVYPITETGHEGYKNTDKDRPQLWVYVKSHYLNYVPTTRYVSTTHKTITNKSVFPFGKANDYQILCTITKDNALYYISRDFVETLIKDQWRWTLYDNEIFEQVTKVIAHFKKINNLSW